MLLGSISSLSNAGVVLHITKNRSNQDDGRGLKEASIERDSVVHRVSLLQMENAVLALFYEGPMRIGTLAISTPGLREGAVGTSSVLLGGKYMIAARALAERVAAVFKRMGIVSLNTRLAEGEALRLYSELLDKVRSGDSKSTAR